jgi:hypothetical protein
VGYVTRVNGGPTEVQRRSRKCPAPGDLFDIGGAWSKLKGQPAYQAQAGETTIVTDKRKPSTKKIPREGRDSHGRFIPGTTGNPKGRTPVAAELKAMFMDLTPIAKERLRQLMFCDTTQRYASQLARPC